MKICKERVLGIGHFGEVLLCKVYDNPSSKPYSVAMKIAKAGQSASAALEHEFRVLQYITSSTPCAFLVTPLFAVDNDSSFSFGMAVEAGGSLSMWLRDRGPLPISTTRLFVSQLASALVHLGSLSVAHRDVKIGNVLLTRGGAAAKLGDFGSSIVLRNGRRAFSVVGTAACMAPEVLRGGPQGYDCLCDWWSLGVLLFELLAHYPVFQRDATALDEQRLLLLRVLSDDGIVLAEASAEDTKAYRAAWQPPPLPVPYEAQYDEGGGDLEAITRRYEARCARELLPCAQQLLDRLVVPRALRLGCAQRGVSLSAVHPFFVDVSAVDARPLLGDWQDDALPVVHDSFRDF
eukprot:gene36639-44444_t